MEPSFPPPTRPILAPAEELGTVRQRLAVAEQEAVNLRGTQVAREDELERLRGEKVGTGGLQGDADLWEGGAMLILGVVIQIWGRAILNLESSADFGGRYRIWNNISEAMPFWGEEREFAKFRADADFGSVLILGDRCRFWGAAGAGCGAGPLGAGAGGAGGRAGGGADAA